MLIIRLTGEETEAQRATEGFAQDHEPQDPWSTTLFTHQVAFQLGPRSHNDKISTFWLIAIIIPLSSHGFKKCN